MNEITDEQLYRELADHIIESLNPEDKDEAEISILTEAVTAIAEFIISLMCSCNLSVAYIYEDGDQCKRCQVLGRFQDKLLER